MSNKPERSYSLSGLKHWFNQNYPKSVYDKFIKNVKDANPGKSISKLLDKTAKEDYITSFFSWRKIRQVSLWSDVQAKYENRKYNNVGGK